MSPRKGGASGGDKGSKPQQPKVDRPVKEKQGKDHGKKGGQ